MIRFRLLILFIAALCASGVAAAQAANSCADLGRFKIDGVEITRAAMILAGTMIPSAYPGAQAVGPLPAHCRVDGVINQRKGVDGEEFGTGFALALPDATAWNGDFMMQGGDGGNGVVSYPLGASFAGDNPALVRGFAVASTDTGHKAKTGPFDFSFMRDQQAYLDFAYQANAEVAGMAKKIVAQYYAKPPAYSYFVGFYEKVIKVKADVAAVLVSAMQRFGSGGGHCQGRRFLAFILTLDSVHHHSDTRVGNEAEHVLCSASFHIGVTFLVPIPRRGVRFPSLL
jgi:hypothetical protein